jgi:hypothetical protein
MSFSSWVRTVKSRLEPFLARQRQPQRQSRGIPGSRPQLEVLEDRSLLSTLSWYPVTNTLTYTSSGVANSLTVSGTTSSFTFHDDAEFITIDNSLYSNFYVTRGDNHTVYLSPSGQRQFPIAINLGGYNSLLNLQYVPQYDPVTITGRGSNTVNLGYGGSVQGIQSTVTVSNPGNFTTLSLDDSADAFRTVTLDNSGGYGRVSGLAPAAIYYDNTQTYVNLTVQTGTAGATVNVTAARQDTSTINLIGHGPNTTVNVGYAGSVLGVQSNVTVTNPPSYTTVNIDDRADTQSRTWYVYTVIPGAVPEYGAVTWGPGVVHYKYVDTRAVTVWTGVGGATVNVYGTGPGVPVTLIGEGPNTTVNVGLSGNVQNSQGTVEGTLTVTNALYYSTLNINDSADTQFHTVTLDTTGGYGRVTGLTPAAILYDSTLVSPTVQTGTGGATINVLATWGATLIGYGANTAVNIGMGGLVQNVHGLVTVTNPPSYTAVTIDDSNDTQPGTAYVYTVDPSTTGGVLYGGVTVGSAWVHYKYADTRSLTLGLGFGTSTVNVQETGVTTNILDSGAATINVGRDGSVAGIQGPLNLENEPNYDIVNINDQNDGAARTVTVSTIPRAQDSSLGAVNGLGAAQITWDYADTTAVNLNLGPGASTVNVLGTGVPTNVFNSGAATVNVGDGGSVAGIQGTLNLENEPNYDIVNINDQNDVVGRTATVDTVTRTGDTSLGRLTGLAPAAITWDYFDTTSVTINGGSGGNVFNIEGTGVPTTINGGSGANIFHVSPTAQSLANLAGLLTLNGSGADTVEFFDQNNPNSETYTFDTVPSNLTLATFPGVSCNFSGMASVYLETNGFSTANDASGTVFVDVAPPF